MHLHTCRGLGVLAVVFFFFAVTNCVYFVVDVQEIP